MKYDKEKFNSAVEEYKGILGDIKSKSFLVVFDIKNKKAFFSIAPLSRAIHELDADMHVIGIDKNSESLDALYDVWKVFKQNKEGKFDEKSKALMEFIEEVDHLFKAIHRDHQTNSNSNFFVDDDKPAMLEVFGNRRERIEIIKLYLKNDTLTNRLTKL